jgi:hypothetical protein
MLALRRFWDAADWNKPNSVLCEPTPRHIGLRRTLSGRLQPILRMPYALIATVWVGGALPAKGRVSLFWHLV